MTEFEKLTIAAATFISIMLPIALFLLKKEASSVESELTKLAKLQAFSEARIIRNVKFSPPDFPSGLLLSKFGIIKIPVYCVIETRGFSTKITRIPPSWMRSDVYSGRHVAIFEDQSIPKDLILVVTFNRSPAGRLANRNTRVPLVQVDCRGSSSADFYIKRMKGDQAIDEIRLVRRALGCGSLANYRAPSVDWIEIVDQQVLLVSQAFGPFSHKVISNLLTAVEAWPERVSLGSGLGEPLGSEKAPG